jgi:hypothetical protein
MVNPDSYHSPNVLHCKLSVDYSHTSLTSHRNYAQCDFVFFITTLFLNPIGQVFSLKIQFIYPCIIPIPNLTL